jgi:hypothetical protein
MVYRQVIYGQFLIDVTESPIERPKKNSETGIRAKRKSTQ